MSKATPPCQFIFFTSYAEALMEIPDEERRAKLALAICEYGTYGTEPDFGCDWQLSALFIVMRPNLDNSRKSYINGKKGGRPKAPAEVDQKSVRKLAKAMATVYETPSSDGSENQTLPDQYEEESERIRRQTEAASWMG